MSQTTRCRILLAGALALATSCTGTVSEPDPGVIGNGPGSVAGRTIQDTPTGPAMAGQLVVSFVPGTAPEAIDAAVAEVGGQVMWHGPYSGCYLLGFDDSSAAEAARIVLSRRPEVTEVARNRITTGSGIGTSPIFQQWNLWAVGLDPLQSWGFGLGVTVAVLDTGVAYEEYGDGLGLYAVAPDLVDTGFVPGYDFINDDDHPNDDQGHGTHVAGVIAADDGIASLAPGASVMPVKVLDSSNQGTELALAEGIYYAVDQGADVINMSLSFSPAYFPSRYLQGAIDYAGQHGVVMVAAVGNHGARVVTYPAAFREVIAVGASQLESSYHVKDPDQPWQDAADKLVPAGYSNAGTLVDVSAPGGVIDQDVDGDGNPEAVLAQTFAGDPTSFDYYFYAGTSQAAAQISGVVAVMLRDNPELDPFQIRALLGETAHQRAHQLLDSRVGRGYLEADQAIAVATDDQADAPRPRYFTTSYLSVRGYGNDQRRAIVEVEVVDAAGYPVSGVSVYGTFTGAISSSRRGKTDKKGQVTFVSSKWHAADRPLVAFQVDAVGGGDSFDRPRGFLRIDSCSLEQLSDFATAAGIGTSPITLDYSVRRNGEVDTLRFLNYSWDLATVPITVGVDRTWYQSVQPDASLSRVVSFGSGIGTSPIQLVADLSFDESWLGVLELSTGDDCVDLLVRTFSPAPDAESPIIPDPEGNCRSGNSCDELRDLLSEMWDAWGAGIGTSPIWNPGMRISVEVFDQLAETVQGYVDFGISGGASPVGDYGQVLDAAGMGLIPLVDSDAESGTGIAAMN